MTTTIDETAVSIVADTPSCDADRIVAAITTTRAALAAVITARQTWTDTVGEVIDPTHVAHGSEVGVEVDRMLGTDLLWDLLSAIAEVSESTGVLGPITRSASDFDERISEVMAGPLGRCRSASLPAGRRPAKEGERCTCGDPAVVIYETARFGDVGHCGVEHRGDFK